MSGSRRNGPVWPPQLLPVARLRPRGVRGQLARTRSEVSAWVSRSARAAERTAVRCAPGVLAVLFVSGLSVGVGLILSSETLSGRSLHWEVHELDPPAVHIQVELIERQIELSRHRRLVELERVIRTAPAVFEAAASEPQARAEGTAERGAVREQPGRAAPVAVSGAWETHAVEVPVMREVPPAVPHASPVAPVAARVLAPVALPVVDGIAQSPSTKNTIFHAPSGPGANPAR